MDDMQAFLFFSGHVEVYIDVKSWREKRGEPLFQISFIKDSPYVNEIIMEFNYCRQGNPPNDA